MKNILLCVCALMVVACDEGAVGIEGNGGFDGEVGPRGETGPQGVTGPQGETGPQGVTGEVGMTLDGVVVCPGEFTSPSMGTVYATHTLYNFKDGGVLATCLVTSPSSQGFSMAFYSPKDHDPYGANDLCRVAYDINGTANGGSFTFAIVSGGSRISYDDPKDGDSTSAVFFCFAQ